MPPGPRSGAEIREAFLRYFERNGHRIVPSSPVVPESDPTLLFTNAGMVQFKGVFTGEERRDYKRAATAQKCVRVSGKHNDLENVGRTPRHHTFFEMLGNFSFGDYFKQQAIAFAWELVTQDLGIRADRLVATVFRDDEEAFAIWRDEIGLPEERVFRLGEDENFWSMGETGPCGPCSEIHYDFRPEQGSRAGEDPSSDSQRFLEIWNLVFMQYDREASGKLTPLPHPSIDTGAGLERLAAVVQGVASNYETDLFRGILARAQDLSGVQLGDDPEKDVSLRVVADHARAVSMMIADGVLPSNEGRGYVLRRILRRAARHGVLLGLERPFFHRVADSVIDELSGAYPQLGARRAFIIDRIHREEERFLETLAKGLSLLEDELRRLRQAGEQRLSGSVAFRLYDTYGFPVDLTEDILRGEGMRLDQAGFEAAMQAQRARARAAWRGSGAEILDGRYADLAGRLETDFVGYDGLHASSQIVALLVDGAGAREARAGDEVEVVVAATPFYAESGGQVGDRGTIRTPGGRVEVADTRRPADALIVHRGRVVEGAIRAHEPADLEVCARTRAGVVRHHSGTHLLHAALHQVLGPQAVQRGSLVAPERLRFDFSHDGPVSREQLERIEDIVNAWVVENVAAQVELVPYQDAIARGAVAMFGEKYGDEVRVVRFGDFSQELCGGTHALASGEVGPFKIVSESGVAAGVRRIEAVTGAEALSLWRSGERELARSAELLRAPLGEVAERVERLLEERRGLERELEALRAERRRSASGDLASATRELAGVKVLASRVSAGSPRELRSLVDELRGRLGSGIVLLASEQQRSVTLALGVTRDLAGRFPAGRLIREVAAVVGGKGGGRPDFAQAGGPDVQKLELAFEKLFVLVERG